MSEIVEFARNHPVVRSYPGYQVSKQLVNLVNKYGNWRRQFGIKSTLQRKIGDSSGRPSKSSEMLGKRKYGSFRIGRRNLSRIGNIHSTGVYAGQNPGGLKKYVASAAAKYGSTMNYETYGNIYTKDVSYFGFQAARYDQIGRHVAIALLRTVMKKYNGYDYRTIDDNIHEYGLSTGEGDVSSIVITVRSMDNAGLYTYVDYIFNVAISGVYQTVRQFADWFVSTTAGTQPSTGPWYLNYAGTRSLWRMQFRDVNDATLTNICLDKARINVFCSSNIVVQNATLSETASASTDVIDANPIFGKMYLFKNTSVPLLREAANNQESTAWVEFFTERGGSTAGLFCPGAAGVAAEPPATFQQIPDGSMFKNCIGSQNILLQPGQSKSFKLIFRYSGFINYLCRNLAQFRSNYSELSADNAFDLNRFALFAFEKKLKAGDANYVRLYYNVDHYVGVRMLRGVGGVMRRENVKIKEDAIGV